VFLGRGSERLAHASFRSSRGLYSGVPYRKKDTTGEVMPLSAYGRVIRKFSTDVCVCVSTGVPAFPTTCSLHICLPIDVFKKLFFKNHTDPKLLNLQCTVYMSLLARCHSKPFCCLLKGESIFFFHTTTVYSVCQPQKITTLAAYNNSSKEMLKFIHHS